MENIIRKLITKEDITDEDIENELFEICDSVHAGCDNECPIFKLCSDLRKQGITPGYGYKIGANKGCSCFKNGNKMLKILRMHKNLL